MSGTTKITSSPQFFLRAATASLTFIIAACGGGGSGQNSDPLAQDTPVVYVERPVPLDDNDNIIAKDILDPDAFFGNAVLYMRRFALSSSPAIQISPSGNYDIKDLEPSYDGTKFLFSMRGPLDPDLNDEDQPPWNIWEYDLDNSSLSRVITDNIRADEGHDISPAYLPDGRIVFSSNRQVRSQAIMLDEIKPDSSTNGIGRAAVDDDEIFNLHILDPATDPLGANIQQITFNNSGHDLQPTVLQDGRIAFLRHDNADSRNNLTIYTINPDGSNLRILYGYHSQRTGNSSNIRTTFFDFREDTNGNLIAVLAPRESDNHGGDIITIDVAGYTDNTQPTNDNSGATGQAQRSLFRNSVNLDSNLSAVGYFNSVYPYSDGSLNMLVSRSLCRQLDGNQIVLCDGGDADDEIDDPSLPPAPPAYGLYGYNASSQTDWIISVARNGFMITDVILLDSKTVPETITGQNIDEDLETSGHSILNIRTVYDTDGTDTTTPGISALADPALFTADERPARFLRLIKSVNIPTEDVRDIDNAAFGLNTSRGMREILGYVPIEPDGSVRAIVPANIPFYFEIVDADGERIMPLHRNLMHTSPGETYQCKGCHTANSTEPHGRDGQVNNTQQPIYSAELPSIYSGGFGIGEHFVNTQWVSVDDVVDGETMAEVYAKTPDNTNPTGPREPITGLAYSDNWTDPAVRTIDADYNLLYVGDMTYDGILTNAPASNGCQLFWSERCRTVINYTDSVQPIWEVTRTTLGAEDQCTDCHSDSGNMGNPQAPAGQLDLSSDLSSAEPLHLVSYRELLEQGIPQVLHPDGMSFLPLYVFDTVNPIYLDIDGLPILDNGGNPIPRVRTFSPADDNVNDIRIQSFTGTVVDVYLDNMGNPILDATNNPIEMTVALIDVDPSSIPGAPVMVLGNAANSSFFDKMEGTAGTVDHSGFMSKNELRLLREWLDIGGQYYNNPFDAPEN